MKSLDTSNFHDLFTSMLEEWKQRSHNDNVYPSDVSYTLLEMMAMLSDMLNYYMESDKEEYSTAYKTLLGINEKQSIPTIPIQCSARQEALLQKGQRFEVPWMKTTLYLECCKTCQIGMQQCISILYHHKHSYKDITYVLKGVQGSYVFQDLQIDDELYFMMDTPFKKGVAMTIYFVIDKGSRNEKGEERLQLGHWIWEYYGIHGWEEITSIQDDTWGFLYSGCMYLTIEKDMLPINVFDIYGYSIRCRLQKDEYDQVIKLQGVTLHTPLFHLQKTTAQCYKWTKCECSVEDAIAKESYVLLKKRNDHEYIEVACTREIQKQHCVFMPSDVQDIKQPLTLICFDHLNSIKYTNGISTQCINLHPFEHVSKVLLRKDMMYRVLNCYEMDECPPFGYGCWQDHQVLRFGNGRDFIIPEKGWEIILMEAKQHVHIPYMGAKSIHYESDTLSFTNAVATKENNQDDLYEFVKRKFDMSRGMINAEDIRHCIQHIPSLALKEVQVYTKQLLQYIVYIDALSTQYQTIIEHHLQTYRMPFQKIEIQPFKEVFIDMKIILSTIDEKMKREYKEHIIQWIQHCMMDIKKDEILQSLRMKYEGLFFDLQMYIDKRLITNIKVEEGQRFHLCELSFHTKEVVL